MNEPAAEVKIKRYQPGDALNAYTMWEAAEGDWIPPPTTLEQAVSILEAKETP